MPLTLKELPKTQEVIKKYFPDAAAIKAYLEKKGILNHFAYDLPYSMPTELLLSINEQGFTLKFNTGTTVASFQLMQYPACCGIKILHRFSYYEKYLPAEMLIDLMETMIEEIKTKLPAHYISMFGYSGRIDVVMVQGGGSYEDKVGAPDTDAKRRYAAAIDFNQEPITGVDESLIHYPAFYEFFTKHTQACRIRRMYNANSGNLLYQMEVIL
jgi:hypothetical protein